MLLLNAAYLAAFAEASLFYFANVALHAILGVALLLIGALRLVRRGLPTGCGISSLNSAIPWWLSAAPLAISGVLGVALLFTGATTPYRWLLQAHIATGILGALVALGWLMARALRAGTRFERVAVGCGTALVVVSGIAAAVVSSRHDDERRARYRIANPVTVPARMEDEGAGPHSPFFPSSANTNVEGIIPANFFLTSATCGRCHKDIYEQWNSSMHHFASFNNQWYRKSIEYMQSIAADAADEMVRRMPRSRGILQRPIREAD